MVQTISFEQILPVWRHKLWSCRQDQIQAHSAMLYLSGHDGNNTKFTPTFWGYIVGEKVVGVNSGHGCTDGTYRSRGLWVDPEYRNRGIGLQLLTATIVQGRQEQARLCWSLPRKTSWNTYARAGFTLVSDWFATDTSDSNAYCCINLKS